MKFGSLFDGSGGFPLAACLCGMTPVWASEVEPYPIAVTRSRFPNMKHLGDISKINGAEIEPVDAVAFGSPCQDVSIAGKRAGLKHEDKGDEETTRSGLLIEAVRVITEMRSATNGKYPRYAIWENVPGAFSSNGGEDFRVVLEELIKIVEPSAKMPPAPKGGWPYADAYMGDGWSLAYRTFDAQHWGVPQRRRRIYLVIDFAGGRAPGILFEREGVRGYFETFRTAWEAPSSNVEGSVGADDCEGAVPYTLKIRSGVSVDSAGKAAGKGALVQTNKAATLAATQDQYLFQPVGFDVYNMHQTGDVAKTLNSAACDADHVPCVAYGWPLGFRPENVRLYEETATTLCNGTRPGFTTAVCVECYESHPQDSRVKELDEVSPTVSVKWHKGTADTPLVCVKEQCLFENHSQDARYRGPLDVCPMLPAQLGTGGNNQPFVVEETKTFAMQGFGDYKESDASSGLKARDYKDATDLIVIDRAFFNQGQNAQYPPQFYTDGTVPTLVARGPSAVCVRYIVRRLTPTECARLQGFADNWAEIDHKEDFTDEEYRFWLDVRNTHAAMNGKAVKEYTKDQMVRWYNKLHSGSAEYKMWGNGVALPPTLYVMQGITEN